MAFGSMELNVVSSRVQDIARVHSVDENRAFNEQSAVHTEVNRKAQAQTKTVNDTKQSEYKEYRYDPSEKGNSSYAGSGNGRKKEDKKKDESKDGSVIVKEGSSFDVKI